jgi:hypothetical protein
MQAISLVIETTKPRIKVQTVGPMLFYYLERDGITTITKIQGGGILEKTGGKLT